MEQQENVNEYTKNEISTSISIPKNIHADIKINGWGFKDLLISGYFARKNEPIWKERVRELEEKLTKLAVKLQEVTQNNWILTEKIQNLEKKNI